MDWPDRPLVNKFTFTMLTEHKAEIEEIYDQHQCSMFLHEVIRNYAVEKCLYTKVNG